MPPVIPFPLLLAVRLHVVCVSRAIALPIRPILPRPRTLRPCLIVPVVGITLPLGPLPTPPPRAPTLFLPAILLIANSRTGPKCPTARGTPRPIHPMRPRSAKLSGVRYRPAVNGLFTNTTPAPRSRCSISLGPFLEHRRVNFREWQGLIPLLIKTSVNSAPVNCEP
jgi:hypothetical protein